MSIPRVALIASFGLISSSGCTGEPVRQAAAAPAVQAQPQRPTTRAQQVVVWIYVLPDSVRGTQQLQTWARSRARPIQPSDIIVTGTAKQKNKKVWMYIHDTFIDHDDKDDHHNELGTVHLSVNRGDHVRWMSDTSFTVDVVKDDKEHAGHKPRRPQTPKSASRPFAGADWPRKSGPDNWVDSGSPLKDSLNQRYKTVVTIGGEQYDPDLVCEP